MNISKNAAFYYHADANALGGILKQPLDRLVSTPASASLAKAGGFSSCQVEKFHVDGLVAVDRAHVHVSGREHEQEGYRTITTASVDGLNILDVVTADRIVAQVSLMHTYGHRIPKISLLGTKFVNLRVNGAPVHLKVDPRPFGAGRAREGEGHPSFLGDLLEAAEAQIGIAPNTETRPPLMTDLLKLAEVQFAERAETQRLAVDQLGERFNFLAPSQDLEESGTALCTLVEVVKAELPAARYGHVIHMPDFGNIFLGELRMSRFAAELTMLRVEMGCMASGSLSACSVRPNGRWCP